MSPEPSSLQLDDSLIDKNRPSVRLNRMMGTNDICKLFVPDTRKVSANLTDEWYSQNFRLGLLS